MSRLSPLHRRSREAIVTDVHDPRAVAVCDGCGMWTMHDHLVERRDYRGGAVPVGLKIWVCGVCDDVPNPYFSKMVLGPDPVPVDHPRPENLSLDLNPMDFLCADYNTPFISGINPQDDTNQGFNYLMANNP